MILVTGGLGMIGAQTARALTELGREVVVTAHGRITPPPFLAGRARVERVDVTDRAAVLALGERYEISDVVHLAGSVPGADPVAFFRADTAGLGDWYVDEGVWPDGLHPLVAAVQGFGMEFGLWVEPEMINLDSDLARAHPEWILATGERLPPPSRHQKLTIAPISSTPRTACHHRLGR